MKKILFKVLDYIISVLMGVGTLLLVSIAISEDWNMFLAMIVGMFLGMVVLFIIVILFSVVSSPFELFMVGMIITMFTGMAAGMVMAMKEVDLKLMFLAVLLFSLFVQIMFDLYNIKLKGDLPIDR